MPRTSESESVLWLVGKHSSEIMMGTFPLSDPAATNQKNIKKLLVSNVSFKMLKTQLMC